MCVGPTSEQLTKSAATGFCLKLSLRSGIPRLLVLEQTSHTGGNTSTIFNLYLLMSAPFTKTTAFKAPRSGWQSKLRFRKALSMAEVGASKSWPGKWWKMMHPNHPMHGLLGHGRPPWCPGLQMGKAPAAPWHHGFQTSYLNLHLWRVRRSFFIYASICFNMPLAKLKHIQHAQCKASKSANNVKWG